jgi:MFS superfamily sulfate permease-like transporter
MVDGAGGRSQISLLVMSGIVLLVLLVVTGPLAYLPETVLAAVVFLIGIDLIDLRGMRKIFAQRRSEFWVALITSLTVVVVGVEQGILLAGVLSLIDHTRRGYRPKNVVLVRLETGAWEARPVATRSQALPGLLIYRFTHSMYYANTQKLTEEITDLVDNAAPPLRSFCIDASAVDDVDFTAAEGLRAIFASLKGKGVRLVVAQVLADVAAESRYQLRQLFSEDAFYATLDDVLHDFTRTTRP